MNGSISQLSPFELTLHSLSRGTQRSHYTLYSSEYFALTRSGVRRWFSGA